MWFCLWEPSKKPKSLQTPANSSALWLETNFRTAKSKCNPLEPGTGTTEPLQRYRKTSSRNRLTASERDYPMTWNTFIVPAVTAGELLHKLSWIHIQGKAAWVTHLSGISAFFQTRAISLFCFVWFQIVCHLSGFLGFILLFSRVTQCTRWSLKFMGTKTGWKALWFWSQFSNNGPSLGAGGFSTSSSWGTVVFSVKGRTEKIKMDEELSSLCLPFPDIQRGIMKKVAGTCSCPGVNRGRCEHKVGELR